MPRRFLSEREGKRGGGLIDPFMNQEPDVELEAAQGGADRLCLRRGGFRRRGWRAGFIYEAFFGMEPCVDSLVDLHRASLVGGEVARDRAGGGFRACSCSGWPVHKV